MSKTQVINRLAALGYRSDGTSHYGKPAGWLITPDGTRGYFNFRDLLNELTPRTTDTIIKPAAPFTIGDIVIGAFDSTRKGPVVAITWEASDRGRGRTYDWQVAIPGYSAPSSYFRLQDETQGGKSDH